MKCKKNLLVATSLALVLSGNVFAQDSYTIQNKTLQEALEIISKQSSFSYVANDKLLKLKEINSIKNVESVEKALELLLKGTGLKAVIKNKTIVITEDKIKNSNLNNNNLGQVIITGTKLSKSLQETVESVQVFDEVDIANSAKMDDLSDIFEQTSSVSRDGEFSIRIRGIFDNGFGGSPIGPATIDVNLDGVSQSKYASRNSGVSTWDLEQVEILKGPQSTTQGRNALAGAIILKTKNPEFDANGAVKVDYSTNNTSRLSVLQTGPITDKLAFRLSAERSASDGFVTNDVTDDDKYNKSESLNVRGKLLYNFDNGGDALLTFNQVKTDLDGDEYVSNGTATTTNVSNVFERKSESQRDGYHNTDIKSYSLEVNQPLNLNWSFKSVTSYHDSEYDRDRDSDDLVGDQYTLLERDSKDFAQEFRFTYQEDKINALFGLYLADSSSISNSDIINILFNSTYYLNASTKLSEDYTNMALFTNIDYELTDKLTLIAGLRIDRDDRISKGSAVVERRDDLGAGVNDFIDKELKPFTNLGLEEDNSTSNILPKLGLNYKLNDNINTGILFSQGYRPGGIFIDTTTGGSESYDAEFTDNLELSFRTKWLENTLTVNANVFYTKYKDMQVSQKNDNGNTVIVNAGKSALKGIELDAKYLVNDELDIYGSIGYIKTKFLDYDSFNGNKFPNTPTVTANIGSTYRHGDGYFIGGNIIYNGNSYTDSENTRITKSYTLTNIKVGYERDEWAVYLYSNNLFDKDYLRDNSTSTITSIGDPRTVGITLTYSW